MKRFTVPPTIALSALQALRTFDYSVGRRINVMDGVSSTYCFVVVADRQERKSIKFLTTYVHDYSDIEEGDDD